MKQTTRSVIEIQLVGSVNGRQLKVERIAIVRFRRKTGAQAGDKQLLIRIAFNVARVVEVTAGGQTQIDQRDQQRRVEYDRTGVAHMLDVLRLIVTLERRCRMNANALVN